jgi:hypothetical protein
VPGPVSPALKRKHKEAFEDSDGMTETATAAPAVARSTAVE